MAHFADMESQHRALMPASTRWNDYMGTVAADDAEVTLNKPGLYELAKLDRERWLIVAVDLQIVEDDVKASVYAIDKMLHEIRGIADVEKIGRDGREVPLTRFVLAEPHVEEFIEHAFKRISMRLISKPLLDYQLVPTEATDRD